MEEDKKSNKAFLGVIVIILVLLAGAYWFWKQNRAELTGNKDAVLEELEETGIDEIILEDEVDFDEFFLDDDLTTFDEIDGAIQ